MVVLTPLGQTAWQPGQPEFDLNKRTGEVHHLPRATEQCQLDEMTERVRHTSLVEAISDADPPKLNDLCGWCFKSKR